MQSTLAYLVGTLGEIYIGICLLRILLQAVRADYYNPFSQFIVKATAGPIRLLRPILPSVGRIDWAAIVWCLLAATLVLQLRNWAAGGGIVPITQLLTFGLFYSLFTFLRMLFFGAIIIVILSWLVAFGGIRGSSPLADLLNQLMEPFLAPFRQLIPPIGGLDLSVIFFIIVINLLQNGLGQLAAYF